MGMDRELPHICADFGPRRLQPTLPRLGGRSDASRVELSGLTEHGGLCDLTTSLTLFIRFGPPWHAITVRAESPYATILAGDR